MAIILIYNGTNFFHLLLCLISQSCPTATVADVQQLPPSPTKKVPAAINIDNSCHDHHVPVKLVSVCVRESYGHNQGASRAYTRGS